MEAKDVWVSLIYSLAKEVPIGVLNRVLLDTIIEDEDVEYCDKELKKWAEAYVCQVFEYKTKFTKAQLCTMNFPKTISSENK